jgi:glutathione S-transferase
VTGAGYAPTEEGYNKAVEKVPVAFERLEKALATQSDGPFFNGAKFSLVDASYAPFLQRYYYLDRVRKVGAIAKFPRVEAWAKALLARPSVHSFPEAEFEAMYREGLRRRKSWLSQFVDAAKVAAE